MNKTKRSPGGKTIADNAAAVVTLIARESAVLARERAADEREEMLTATAP